MTQVELTATVKVMTRATYKRSEKRGGRAVLVDAEYVEVPLEVAAAMLCDMAIIKHPEDEEMLRGALKALKADCAKARAAAAAATGATGATN